MSGLWPGQVGHVDASRSECWALGVVIHDIVTGIYPFDALDKEEYSFEQICSVQLPGVSSHFHQLTNWLLHPLHSKRPTAKEACTLFRALLFRFPVELVFDAHDEQGQLDVAQRWHEEQIQACARKQYWNDVSILSRQQRAAVSVGPREFIRVVLRFLQ